MIRSLVLGASLALAATACKPPPDLDDDTDDLSMTEAIPLLFSDFEQGPERLVELVEAVERGVERQGFDLGGDKAQRTFSLAVLPHEGLDVTTPDGTDPANQTPVVVFGRSAHGFDLNLDIALQKNQVCIESNSTVYLARTYTPDDEAAFRAGTEDVLRSTNEVRKELGFIAKGWYDIKKDFRRFELEDGREVLAGRAWLEKVFFGDGGNNKFAQTFTAELWIDDGAGKTTRVYAIWPEISIGLGPDAMRSLIGDSLDEGFLNADAFGDGSDLSYCRNDRDRAYDRPQQ